MGVEGAAVTRVKGCFTKRKEWSYYKGRRGKNSLHAMASIEPVSKPTPATFL